MDTTLSQCAVDDLSSSGLSQDIIGEMAILPLSDTTYTLYKGLQKSDHEEGYLIPYHGVNPNFGRRKNIPPLVVDGDERKYSSPYEGGSHLYILPHDREMLRSPKCSIIIGEGEKTTAKYSQELRNLITPHQKYAAVGISGLWQFLSSPETLTISWKNHPIFFGFDVDIEFNSQSILAVYRMIGYLVSKDVPLSQILMFTWDIIFIQARGVMTTLLKKRNKALSPMKF